MKRHLSILATIAVLFGSAAFAERSDDFKALLARADLEAGDFAAAIAKAQPLADAGDPRAQTLLGAMYANGEGLPADPAKALEYTRKAADQGHPQALTNLANIYRFGMLGVTEDDVKARELYAQAVALDFGQARGELASMLREGEGGPVDAPMAVALLERAVVLGDPDGTAEYAYMLATGTGVPVDQPRGRKLYAAAAEQGLYWAERDYGEMLELAEGGPTDLTLALEYYRRAAAQGYGMAAFDIFEMYRANTAALPDLKAEALAMCLYAEAQPPHYDGAEYDGLCDPAFPDYTTQEIAAAREAAAEMVIATTGGEGLSPAP